MELGWWMEGIFHIGGRLSRVRQRVQSSHFRHISGSFHMTGIDNRCTKGGTLSQVKQWTAQGAARPFPTPISSSLWWSNSFVYRRACQVWLAKIMSMGLRSSTFIFKKLNSSRCTIVYPTLFVQNECTLIKSWSASNWNEILRDCSTRWALHFKQVR